MADFTLGNIGGPQGSPVSPKSPVIDTGTGVAIQGLANLAGSVFGAVTAGQIQEQKLEAEEAKAAQKASEVAAQGGVLGEYSQNLIRIADAYKQGLLTESARDLRVRQTTAEAFATNPALTPDLMKVRKEVITTPGLGKVLGVGTEEAQARQRLEDEVFKMGLINPLKFTSQEMDEAISMVAKRKSANRAASDAAELAAAKQADVTLSTTQLKLAKDKAAADSRAAVKSLVETHTFGFLAQMSKLKSQVDQDLDPKEAAMLANEQWNVLNAEITRVGADSGSTYLTTMSGPIKNILDNTLAGFDGSMETEIVESQNKLTKALLEKEWFADEVRGRVTMAKGYFENIDIGETVLMRDKTVDFIQAGISGDTEVNVVPKGEEGKKDVKVAFDNINTILAKVNSGTAINPEKTKKDVKDFLTNAMKDLDAFSLTTNNAADYEPLVRLLATPSMGAFFESEGGVPSEISVQTKLILKEKYENEVVPLIQEEFDKAQVLLKELTPTQQTAGFIPGLPSLDTSRLGPAVDVIEPVFTDGGVSFRAKVGASDFRVKGQIQKLNKTVTPIVNRYIRMSAHVDAHRDYKRTYDEIFTQVFGAEQEGVEAQPTQEVRSRPKAGDIGDGFRFKADDLDNNDANSWENIDG